MDDLIKSFGDLRSSSCSHLGDLIETFEHLRSSSDSDRCDLNIEISKSTVNVLTRYEEIPETEVSGIIIFCVFHKRLTFGKLWKPVK